ncbi:hypothetical protein GCM10009555_104680 [Acrocarpospora macrocephala]|uniref:Uncharacterized protein n=1 Tax=Acrocarpospora macrocephala TaxID=150177 RepID=A0A5M3WWW8_9ACTN|nr:hypothetical protein Amac_063190 [Acrocarpospora macrocephala]
MPFPARAAWHLNAILHVDRPDSLALPLPSPFTPRQKVARRVTGPGMTKSRDYPPKSTVLTRAKGPGILSRPLSASQDSIKLLGRRSVQLVSM